MPDERKPLPSSSRADSAQLPDDGGFSIETTTMRLKSLKLRRAEAADKALEDSRQPPSEDRRNLPPASGPAGRVRHDARGMAVWDWAAASGEVAGLSATNVMRKLDVSGLSIEQTQRSLKAMQPLERDVGGGIDPYNTRKATGGDPYNQGKRAGSGVDGDPYNQRGNAQRTAPPMKRPVPATPVKPPGSSVLDQLTGKKK